MALSESTPGPLAVNMATFVGMRTCGVLEAIIATLGIVLPSFIIILIIAKFFEKYKKSKAVGGIMSGLKPAVVGMIGAAFITVARTVFFPSGVSVSLFSSASFCVFLGLFAVTAALAFKKVHPIKIILLSAVIGITDLYGLGIDFKKIAIRLLAIYCGFRDICPCIKQGHSRTLIIDMV